MRGITALAVLALVGPAFAQGEPRGPDRRPGPDGRRGAGIEQKLEEILHRLERLEQRVEERDRDMRRDDDRRHDRMRRHDRDERSPRRGPARRDGSRRGDRPQFRPDRSGQRGFGMGGPGMGGFGMGGPGMGGPGNFGPGRGGPRGPNARGPGFGGPGSAGPDRAGPDAAPMAQFRRLMQAAKQGNPQARQVLESMYKAIGQMLAKDKKAQHKKAQHKKAQQKDAKQRAHKKVAMAVQRPATQYKVVLEDVNAANKRRESAIKLMKVEEMRATKAEGKFEIERRKVEELQRAARIAELRAQAVRLQKEIEMLKRELAK